MSTEDRFLTGPIVAAVDGTESALDAAALARDLAHAAGAPLILLCVGPERAAAGAATAASAALEAARQAVGDAAAAAWVIESSSPARGLTEFAEREGAGALVVGSTNRGAIGRVLTGSTAERLLQGANCPVAVTVRGYRRGAALRSLGAAFTDSDEGREAVRAAADLALRSGLPLTVYSVVSVSATWFTPQAAMHLEAPVPAEVRHEHQAALDDVLATLPEGVPATGRLLVGDVVDELSLVNEHGTDLLVCGSRSYGPVRRVLLGTVSAALVRRASVPVLVVPRGDPDRRHRTSEASAGVRPA